MKIPYQVVFTLETGEIDHTFLPEKITDFVKMPKTGDIVVRVEGGESYWFNSEGRHPKSFIVFKEEDDV